MYFPFVVLIKNYMIFIIPYLMLYLALKSLNLFVDNTCLRSIKYKYFDSIIICQCKFISICLKKIITNAYGQP